MGDGRALAERIAGAKSLNEATSLALEVGLDLVGARATGIYVFTESGVEVLSRGIVERDLERYQAYCANAPDPLLVHMTRELSAVHNRMLYSEVEWTKQPIYDLAIAPGGLCHYQVSPLFRDGHMIGALTYGRAQGEPAFDGATVSRASAIAAYLSSKLSPRPYNDITVQRLSDRQRMVVTLVAKGLTNPEIASTLHISVNYVKKILKDVFAQLGVTTRAELAGIVAPEVL